MNKFCVSEEDQENVITKFNITKEEAEKKLKLLIEWAQSCSHLPEESRDENFLKMMLMKGKFRDTIVKKNIENYFMYIKKHPEYFTKLGTYQPSKSFGIAIATMLTTPSWERIGILKSNVKKLEKKNFTFEECFFNALTTGMLLLNHDYSASTHFIIDMEGITIRHLLQVNIMDLFKIMEVHENILKVSISGIEVINTSHFISLLLKILKLVLKPKLYSRVTIHNDLCSLHKNIHPKYLPSDYGGELYSIEELIEIWDKIYQTEKPFFGKIKELAKENYNEGV